MWKINYAKKKMLCCPPSLVHFFKILIFPWYILLTFSNNKNAYLTFFPIWNADVFIFSKKYKKKKVCKLLLATYCRLSNSRNSMWEKIVTDCLTFMIFAFWGQHNIFLALLMSYNGKIVNYHWNCLLTYTVV